jgi:hypothetical protein
MSSEGSAEARASDNLPDSQNLEYLRRVFDNVLAWYGVADSKAQLILTLDGIIITLSSSGLLVSPLHKEARADPWLLLAAAVLLAMSIYFAVDAMHSNLSEANLRAMGSTGLAPEHMWWFGTIATLARTPREARYLSWRETLVVSVPLALIGRPPVAPMSGVDRVASYLETMGAEQERRALASQIVLLSAHVLAKHRNVNRGWISAGCALGLLLMAMVVAGG